MSGINALNIKRVLVILALAGAITAAYGSGNYLSYAGISYYIVCIIAVLLNYQRSNLLLWAAVGFHALLTGYAVWRWQAAGIAPCSYCLTAAGLALVAAVAHYRPKLAIAPIILMMVIWYGWSGFIMYGNQRLYETEDNYAVKATGPDLEKQSGEGAGVQVGDEKLVPAVQTAP
ncbi:MAG: hypothetical protein ACYDEQ_15250, partial [Desulfocucumaceae bacterium]